MALEKITRTTINRLRRRAQRRQQTAEVRDVVQPGLCLRLTGRRLTWYFRYSTTILGPSGRTKRTAEPVCSVDACGDPDAMRKVIAAGRAGISDGRDAMAAVRTALAEILKLPETRVRPGETVDPDQPVATTWDVATLRREFRDHPPAWLREETVKSYYRAMAPSQVGVLNRRLLVEITAADIRAVRADIEKRGKARQASLTVQAIKTTFDWAAEPQQSPRSGITDDTNPATEVSTKRRKPRRTKAQAIEAAKKVAIDAAGNVIIDDPTLPTPDDLGRFANLLATPGKLELMKRAVLLLLLYSVQRRFTVASALRRTVLAARARGCGLWVLDGGTTKAGRPHVLPFADIVASVIEEWKATLPAGDWLFPGLPTRAKPRASGHINARTINDWLKEAWVLAGASRVYSPHRLRRAFETHLSRKGVSRADRKLILDHSEGRAGDVTEEHYNLDPQFGRKSEVIGIWENLLNEFAERAKCGRPHPGIFVQETREPVDTAESEVASLGEAPADLPTPSRPATAEDASPEPGSPILAEPLRKTSSTDPARLERLRKQLDKRASFDRTLAREGEPTGGAG